MNLSYLKNGKIVSKCVPSVKFDTEVDVLVVGLGASGCYAAIAAAREGASVMGIEREEGIGGMPINGGVLFFYYGERGGTYETVDKNASLLDEAVFLPRGKQTETRRAVLHEELEKSGVKYITGVTVIGLYMTGNRVTGARIYDKGRTFAVKCTMLVDATSDGHVVRACPLARTYLGRGSDGKTVPFTNRSSALADAGNLTHYNGDDGYCNQYEPYGFSERVLAAHASKLSFMNDESSRLIGVAVTPGVREGIRYEGEDYLTYRDIIYGKEPEKVLFFARSDLDKHGSDHAMDDDEYKNWWVVSNLATVTARIPVPLGAVVPRGVLGMVTAGRCLSVDSYASSAVRMNTDMFRLGECVGIGAALAVRAGCAFHEIDYEEFVKKCDEYGCRRGVYKDKFAYDHPSKKGFYEKVSFDMTDEEMIATLSTDAPGVAVWAAHVSKRDIDGMLLPYLLSENANLRFNSAIALGARGCDKCLPVLRSEVKNRNFEKLAGCRRSNQFKSAVAICLIGSLGDSSDYELLLPLITPDELGSERYSEICADGDEGALARSAYYQIFTHAAVALCKIAKREGDRDMIKRKIDSALTAEFCKRIISTVTHGKPESSLGVEIADFLRNVREI